MIIIVRIITTKQIYQPDVFINEIINIYNYYYYYYYDNKNNLIIAGITWKLFSFKTITNRENHL